MVIVVHHEWLGLFRRAFLLLVLVSSIIIVLGVAVIVSVVVAVVVDTSIIAVPLLIVVQRINCFGFRILVDWVNIAVVIAPSCVIAAVTLFQIRMAFTQDDVKISVTVLRYSFALACRLHRRRLGVNLGDKTLSAL